MSILDLILYIVAVVGVIALGIWTSRDAVGEVQHGEKSTAGYFLPGWFLSWGIVVFAVTFLMCVIFW